MSDIQKPSLAQSQTPSNPVEIITKAIPESKKNDEVKAAIMMLQEEYSGPIPHPSAMREYEAILPGSADRILVMAEKQQEHRMEMEKKAISAQLSHNKRGQIFGFVIFFISIVVAIVFAARLDMKEFAGIFLSVTMISLISIFVLGKRDSNKDLSKKRKDFKD